MAITKKELISELSKRTGLTNKMAKLVIDEFITILQQNLKENNLIRLPGFGTFKIVKRKEKKGRNPQTGEEIIIPARKVAKFVPGKNLKAL